MKASIKNLIKLHSNGLLEIKPAIRVTEYRKERGFGLKKSFVIFKSKRIRCIDLDWFSYPGKNLKNLFYVIEDSLTDTLTVYILEIMKNSKIHCYLVLSNDAYRAILKDKKQEVLQVHQMSLDVAQTNLAINMLR